MRYGQRPSIVGEWDVAEFDEAFIVWQGEGKYQVTEDEVKEERALYKGGFILDRDQNYWSRMITDGKLDRDKLLAKNYRPSQVSFIQAEMQRLGWL